MERIALPAFKLLPPGANDIGSKMDKVKNAELVSKVYQLGLPQHPPKAIFKTNQSLPLRPKERDRLARNMSTEDVMNTNQYYEDETSKGQRRWKEIRHLFFVTRQAKHSRGSLENALWYYSNNGITCNHFVHAIMDEFNFVAEKGDENDDMEAHLRWLYWSFNGGTSDKADWRDILGTLRVPIFYRMVQTRPSDLLLAIFDIYAVGGTGSKTSHLHPNESWYISNVSQTLRTIFCIPCETQWETETMTEMVDRAILSNFYYLKKTPAGLTKEQKIQLNLEKRASEEAAVVAEAIANGMNVEEAKTLAKRNKKKNAREDRKEARDERASGGEEGNEEEKVLTGAERLAALSAAKHEQDLPYELQQALRHYDIKMYRKNFRAFMRTHHDSLVVKFQEYSWKRLPVDLRLASLDEQQVIALRTSDNIMYRFKLQQAMHIYRKNLTRVTFNDWAAAAKSLSVVRRHAQRRFKYRKVQLFKFWRKLASTRAVKVKRRILAEVMGDFSLKARYFYRIKLFNYQTGYIMRTVGTFNRHAKKQKAAFSHLREYVRLAWLRKRYHQWWNNCVKEHNMELAIEHDWHRRFKPILKAWHLDAQFELKAKRMENVAIENKMDFDRKMREASEHAIVIQEVEKAKLEREEQSNKAREEVEKQERLEKARKLAQQAKKEERMLILAYQKDNRRRRVRKQMSNFKKKFAKKWETKTSEFIDKAKLRIDAYVQNPENEMAIEMKFRKLKREFYAPPSRENRDRETVLTNHKNIVFLYLDAKLRNDNLTMEKVLYKWDKDKRGYLTYEEFKEMIKALGVKLNPSQLSHVIRAVDADGDGCIELKELLDSMADIDKMGVKGSPWKMYVDAAQDVIVYHNFTTDNKVFEYNMTDEILMDVTTSNLYGMADEEARKLAEVSKDEDWVFAMNTFMAKRLQFMYRYWKSKKARRQWLWKLKTRESNAKNKRAFQISSWCTSHWHGKKARSLFAKELKFTYEKVYKADSKHVFWFNHLLKTSHWDRPHVLWRYGDAKMPNDWIPIDVPTVTEEELAADPEREQLYAMHYWHVKAERDIPRKPDGLPLCLHCHRNLAIEHCNECNLDYCHTCLRETHASPYGFKQKSVLSIAERQDYTLLQKLKFNISHTFSQLRYPRCGLCRTEKVLAGMFCTTCAAEKGGMPMCRPCCRRIHERLPDHEMHAI